MANLYVPDWGFRSYQQIPAEFFVRYVKLSFPADLSAFYGDVFFLFRFLCILRSCVREVFAPRVDFTASHRGVEQIIELKA